VTQAKKDQIVNVLSPADTAKAFQSIRKQIIEEGLSEPLYLLVLAACRHEVEY